MTEKFVASNGVEIDVQPENRSEEYWVIRGPRGSIAVNTDEQQAFREFFQAERDKNLGLWRLPEDPDFTVKRKPERDDTDGRYVIVASESSGSTWSFWEFRVSAHGEGQGANVARAYFAAHPEPKPWRDSKPGEVWVLSLKGESQDEVGAVREYGRDFKLSTGLLMSPKDERITAGRRIWPEVSDASA